MSIEKWSQPLSPQDLRSQWITTLVTFCMQDRTLRKDARQLNLDCHRACVCSSEGHHWGIPQCLQFMSSHITSYAFHNPVAFLPLPQPQTPEFRAYLLWMSGTCFVGCSFKGGTTFGCCGFDDPYIDTSVGERGWLLITHTLSLSMKEPVSELFNQELKQTMLSLKEALWEPQTENAGKAFKVDWPKDGYESNCKTNHAPNSHQEKILNKWYMTIWDITCHTPQQMKSHWSFPQALEYSLSNPHPDLGTRWIYFKLPGNLPIPILYQLVLRREAASLESCFPVLFSINHFTVLQLLSFSSNQRHFKENANEDKTHILELLPLSPSILKLA